MKKLINFIIVILIAFFIIPVNIEAFASKITDKEILIEAENMMPGDIVQGELELKNQNDHPINVILHADEIFNSESIELLEVLNIEILYDENVIYNDVASELNKNNKLNIYLGKLNKDEKKTIKVKAYLNGEEVGNEYQDQKGECKLIFRTISNEVIGDDSKDDTLNSDDHISSSNKPSNNRPILPSTGMVLSVVSIIISIILILIGYKLIKKK